MLSMSEEKKTEQVLVRLSPSEHARLEAEADRQQRRTAQLARMLLLGGLDGAPVERLRIAPSADEPREPHLTEFPVEALAAAGSGREASFVPTGEKVSVPNTLARAIRSKDLHLVRVVGNSMEPTYLDGDIVTVEFCDMAKARSGDVVYVRFNGDPQIKELRIGKQRKRPVLLPRNTIDHDPIPILDDDEVEFIGIIRDLAQRRDASKKR